ncbi:MAG: AraC family ligand binding domain-containing protein [Clostridia bacterium]|nr:AraC family ligand binding domain-containing protein [Clostridia bacterium]
MRKKDIINTDYIIDDMYLSVSHAANGYVNLDNYVDITNQNVLVRLHTPSTYVNYHAHDCFEINYVYRGNCINLVENNLHFMDEGDLIILHPDAYHNLYSPNESKIFNFLIRKDWFFNVLNTYKLDASPVSTFIEYSTKKNHYDYIMCSCSKDSDSAKSKIRKLAVNLIKKSQSDGPTRFLLMESAAIEFFCALVTECKTASWNCQYMYSHKIH